MPLSSLIRPIEELDLAAFREIQRDALMNSPEAFGSDYEWFQSLSLLSVEQRLAKYLNFPYQYLLGAFSDEGAIVGMVGFSTQWNVPKLQHKGRIWGLYVPKSHRKQGIASALVDTVLTSADEIGCELIQLSVGTQNKDSYALYLRKGFAVYGTEARALKVGETFVDEYLMVKMLR